MTTELPNSSDGGGNKNHHQADGGAANTGIEDERVLLLVFRAVAFDPRVVSAAACVSRRLRAVARRVLWRGLCVSRAPRMASALALGPRGSGSGGPPGVGGWHALAKLLFYCCGSPRDGVPGHLAAVSRFSKTSGRSFLHRRCRGDLLYVSDPCEHAVEGRGEDVGLYRGVFRGFVRSRTRACLVGRRAELEARVRCPYCRARVWSMSAAGLVPRSASRRLGSHEGRLEYFVCVNGHLHGSCWLARLSDDDDDGGGDGSCDGAYDDEDDDDEEEEEEEEEDVGDG